MAMYFKSHRAQMATRQQSLSNTSSIHLILDQLGGLLTRHALYRMEHMPGRRPCGPC